MRRREFIAGLGGLATWPLAARAQPAERVRRIGMLMALDENDPAAKLRLSPFMQALAALGWTDGRNMRIDLRWFGGDINRRRRPGSHVPRTAIGCFVMQLLRNDHAAARIHHGD
jgi:putative ABC transport system substrate-binding protein